MAMGHTLGLVAQVIGQLAGHLPPPPPEQVIGMGEWAEMDFSTGQITRHSVGEDAE
jgi:hypothetical protein